MMLFEPIKTIASKFFLDEDAGMSFQVNDEEGMADNVLITARDSGEQARFTMDELRAIGKFVKDMEKKEDGGGVSESEESEDSE